MTTKTQQHNLNNSSSSQFLLQGQSQHTVFALRSEVDFGMPWCPLWMLSRLILSSSSCACVCASDQRKLHIGNSSNSLNYTDTVTSQQWMGSSQFNMKPAPLSIDEELSRSTQKPYSSRPPSIHLKQFLSSTPEERLNAANEALLSMKKFGYAVISVDEFTSNIITNAYDSLLNFFTPCH